MYHYFFFDRMGFFEKRGVLLSSAQIQSQVLAHYRQQLMLQIYVVIFGLDVLGNPYGLIKDITEGLGELFYEPLLVRGSLSLHKRVTFEIEEQDGYTNICDNYVLWY